MTVWRVPGPDGPLDYIYIDDRLGALRPESGERGVWINDDLWIALGAVSNAADTLIDCEPMSERFHDSLIVLRRMILRLDATPGPVDVDDQADDASSTPEPIRYEVHELPANGGFGIWDVVRERFTHRGIKTRDAADDKAGVMNHGPAYRPVIS